MSRHLDVVTLTGTEYDDLMAAKDERDDLYEAERARADALAAELKALRDDVENRVQVAYSQGFLDRSDLARAVPASQDDSADRVANICNAYESGVGHRGRPTANVNPYPRGSDESIAYALGAIKEHHGMTDLQDDARDAERDRAIGMAQASPHTNHTTAPPPASARPSRGRR